VQFPYSLEDATENCGDIGGHLVLDVYNPDGSHHLQESGMDFLE